MCTSPEKTKLTLYTANSRLTVPGRAALNDGFEPFEEAESASPLPLEEMRAPEHRREVSEENGATVLTIHDDFGEYKDLTHGLITGEIGREVHTISPGDPLSARASTQWTQTLSRDDGWSVRTEAVQEMRASEDMFYLSARIEAYEGDELVFEKKFTEEVPRDLV